MIGLFGRLLAVWICISGALGACSPTTALANEGTSGVSGPQPDSLSAYLGGGRMLQYGPDPAQRLDWRTGTNPSPAPLVAVLLASPLRFEASAEPVTLLIANQRTRALRTTDTQAEARKRRVGRIARLLVQREREDANFANRTKILAARMAEKVGFRRPPKLAAVTTGAKFLISLISASRRGRLTNVVVYGHAASTGLYMIEDRGFYAAVSDVAKSTRLVTGTNEEKEKKLRAMGARDLKDLETLIKYGAIRFAENATIIFAGCGVAGRTDVEVAGIASRTAVLSGATVIASVGVTDQSMARRPGTSKFEYSRVTWVLFVKGSQPKKLQTKTLDVTGQLTPAPPYGANTPQVDRPITSPIAPQIHQFHCAVGYIQASEGSANACGRKSNNEGNTIV